ncbi:MAG TPA: thioredoxin domain-containing protein [Microlunatus sp.]|nr:thioredoxin domain-containing protein [Microlunatus sp.]
MNGQRLSARQRALAEQQAAQRRRERRVLALVVGGVVVALVVAGIGLQAWRTNRAPDAGSVTPGRTSAPVTITPGQPVSFGSGDAPVTVDLYEDFHCPHCAEFEEQLGPTLQEAQDAGQIRLRIFPMAFIDAGSASAANGFACAAEAGFGESYYTALFANHTLDWSDSQLNQLAEQVSGSVPEGFATCVTQRSHQDWVSSIDGAASTAGVTGTPTMFLDGRQVDIATLTTDGLTSQIAEAGKQ